MYMRSMWSSHRPGFAFKGRFVYAPYCIAEHFLLSSVSRVLVNERREIPRIL